MPKPRSPRSALVNAIDQSRWPAYLLDDELRLVFGNEALQKWLADDWSELIERSFDQVQEIESVRGKQWARILLPPLHSRTHNDLPFTVIAPEANELTASPKSVESLPEVESFQGRVSTLIEGARTWYLVVLSPASSEREEVPNRFLELHAKWERTQRQEADEAADLFAGESAAAQRLREQVTLAARGAPRVSLVGPTGSGHEAVAQWIFHHRPESARGPFATLECTLLDAELLQSTFRDLVRESRGTDSPPGCLVLLSVDRLAHDGQLELLNLLRFPKVPVSTIVTSIAPLESLVAQGVFDAELATRLTVMRVELPAFRDRIEDLPVLAHAVLQRASESQRAELLGWSEGAISRLQKHLWPNNFDELRTLAKRLSQQVTGNWVQPTDLPRWLGQGLLEPTEQPQFRLQEFRLEEFLRQCEAELMKMALQQCGGNKTKAARLLGLSRGGFHRRWDSLSTGRDSSADSPQELEESSDDEPT